MPAYLISPDGPMLTAMLVSPVCISAIIDRARAPVRALSTSPESFRAMFACSNAASAAAFCMSASRTCSGSVARAATLPSSIETVSMTPASTSDDHVAIRVERGADEIRHVLEAIGCGLLTLHGLRALADAGAVAVALGRPFDAGIMNGGRHIAVRNQDVGAGVRRREGIGAARYIILCRRRRAGHGDKWRAGRKGDADIARPRAERRRDRHGIGSRRRGDRRGLALHGIAGGVVDHDVLPAPAIKGAEHVERLRPAGRQAIPGLQQIALGEG